ncbi:nuclear transport factor 2 family protein [Streptomyces sp. NBC_00842]|uniref:nuclear transport factor 2 family protein n=1 Tax=Streptomyces sp. NBC_00842 TaxID=2975848 RepID=UPI00386C7145|nr:nuclear transport factor 2 family protein [Streptomyces sp. NBC_00842]
MTVTVNSLDVVDRLAIMDTCNRMALYVDEKRWPELAALMADEIGLDYTDVSNRGLERFTRAEYEKHAAALLVNDPITQHLVASHIVEGSGDQARCVSQFQATHALPNTTGDSSWVLGGQYDRQLVKVDGRWLIRSIKVTRRWTTGNWQVVVLGRAQ